MLQLLKLQQKHRFTLYAIGDPKQAGAIEAPVMDLLVETLGAKVPSILTSVRQKTEREREIAGLFREGKAQEAIAMKLEDRTAELVAGGRAPTIERIAAKWMELSQDPTSQPTIGVASNRDAHDIGVAIRRKLQEHGMVGQDKVELDVLTRGETGVHKLALAENDKVRVFNRVVSKGKHFASNGDVLTILDVSKDGMSARNDAGAETFVGGSALMGRHDPAPKLAYGHALTIDASQGISSRQHIDAVVSGSWLHQGGKGYVNESRQTETTHLIFNEAAERRKIFSQLPRGQVLQVRAADVWQHVAENMNRPTVKATALDFLRKGTQIYRGSVTALPRALEPAERRERAGEIRMTLPQRWERMALRRTIERMHEISHSLRQRPSQQHDWGPSL